ncbi:MAG: hypothetical protein A2499_04545 [Stygiobacter sp. RIFOXYC12_FULL_38_8]|nr:MAG: hypothetical protein A2X62_00265 [Stygiobacter sp. GWC2_38_9]OGV07270.1 MAG: hypothetical protein A2299_04385 [Stygiobacter sp. RIFOXYB2_FULL_37_11]OGV09938.1 MAG: hypothetical protein A2237_05310 [Stygiobacter sp. RIFOXYA2_FULL_38_8]OGV15829.1 MAG: hypothetical protein A2440_02170 [Stygiobacter sp. RIFOXYC2_FULL_38_25]OGV22800.1 MAG: hypothetical protein A2499_04545 [Stygiobacter sp. RIFOXYC12_FULL_38_8]OGV80943.1 MAG: hypothetical protein A2X65_07220 [Stygiobacter sp. GWF2_38_21]RJQ
MEKNKKPIPTLPKGKGIFNSVRELAIKIFVNHALASQKTESKRVSVGYYKRLFLGLQPN